MTPTRTVPSDATAGSGAAPPALDGETRVRVQRALAAQGFDAGQADGSFGPRTRGAIRTWQQAKGYAATGELTGGRSSGCSRTALRVLALRPETFTARSRFRNWAAVVMPSGSRERAGPGGGPSFSG